LFDPSAWNTAAWLQSQGILPGSLRAALVGGPPGATAQPFQLDVHSLVHDYFLLDQTPREELDDLYHLPFFFQAAELDLSVGVQSLPVPAAEAAATGRLDRKHEDPAYFTGWPAWSDQTPDNEADLSVADVAQRRQPHVLASFANRVPYLVEQRIGRGRVLFVSSGFSPSWSTIGLTNAIIVFDRILRDMLQATFPTRNMTTDQRHVEPLSAAQRHHHFTLTGPNGLCETLNVDAIGPDRHAVTVRPPAMRGLYRVSAASANGGNQEQKVWEFPLAVNGPADESQLRPPAGATTEEPRQNGDLWIAADSRPSGESQMGAQYLWRRWMLAALVCLLVEMVVLGNSGAKTEGSGAMGGLSARAERSLAGQQSVAPAAEDAGGPAGESYPDREGMP
jgi:hypothetical protein